MTNDRIALAAVAAWVVLAGPACGDNTGQVSSDAGADSATDATAGVDAVPTSCPAVSPGQLDPGFGNSGGLSVIFDSGSNSQAEGVVLQPDGKLVMVGTYSSMTAPLGGMFVARYTQTGGLDPSFGAGAGYVTDTTMNGGDAVALLPSGDLLVGGYQKKMGMLVQRYSASGVRDATFGSGGTSVVSFSVDGIHPHDIGTILDQEGVAVRTGHHCAQPVMDFFGVPATARASLAFYNTHDEIDALSEGLHQVREVFGG